MRNEDLNPCVLGLDDSHAAKKFLLAFIECRRKCVGLHLDPDEPIEHEWESLTDGRVWTFSGFAYAFLSLDILLDEFYQSVPRPNEANSDWPWSLPTVRSLVKECAQTARQSGNDEILDLTHEVLKMLDLWEDYLQFRQGMISREAGQRGQRSNECHGP